MFDSIASGIHYLHESVLVLHNDIKDDNVVLEGEISEGLSASRKLQPVLIDFNSSCFVSKAKVLPRENEQTVQEKLLLYPHIAPEVNSGRAKQSKSSDCYSYGYLLHRVCKGNHVLQTMLYSTVSGCTVLFLVACHLTPPTVLQWRLLGPCSLLFVLNESSIYAVNSQ